MAFSTDFTRKSGVFFTDLTQKIGIFDRFYAIKWRFLQILREKLAFFGVNFIIQKFCPCKKNDKYEVCECWASGDVDYFDDYGDYGDYDDHTSYLSFFLHSQNFWRIKFTPKNANFSR